MPTIYQLRPSILQASHPRFNLGKMFRPSKSQDWEPYKDTIAALYEVMKLKDVMQEMEATHGFKATEKQYKTQLKKWNLDTKYVKASEYLAMVRIRREREAGNPPKDTQFILRGRVVENRDITRFERRASKKGSLQLDQELDAEALADLRYETPPPDTFGYAYAEASTSQYQYPSAGYQASQYQGTPYQGASSQYQDYQDYDDEDYTY